MNQIEETRRLKAVQYAKDIEGTEDEFKSVCYTAISFLAIFVMVVCGTIIFMW